MFRQLFVLLTLVTLGITTPIGLNTPRAAASMCLREIGVYDVCDTLHSFTRCRGNRPMMVFDCKHDPAHYCSIQDDKGSCSGLLPPPMNGTLYH
ncbi:hypothetical protein SAMD00023353_2800220 [Rosellinia necatrix]|uniref:Uncharacterized protein n=1 Tax=Rosellinia necatrix TaxID=77044 RepID=A0A1W2THT3_ROSNE|nr:hypothetical protein SAMD00023353_2800220 [Rosellinia necatrix]